MIDAECVRFFLAWSSSALQLAFQELAFEHAVPVTAEGAGAGRRLDSIRQRVGRLAQLDWKAAGSTQLRVIHPDLPKSPNSRAAARRPPVMAGWLAGASAEA